MRPPNDPDFAAPGTVSREAPMKAVILVQLTYDAYMGEDEEAVMKLREMPG